MNNFIKNLIYLIAGLVVAAIVGIFYHRSQIEDLNKQTVSWLKKIKTIERAIIEKIPTFEDYLNQENFQNLRKYLLPDHLRAIQALNAISVKNEDELQNLLKDKTIVAVNPEKKDLFYFYNVAPGGRYLTPQTLAGLKILSQRFQENLQKKSKLIPPIKLAISSALRSEEYQKKLRNSNTNATSQTSHSYGISFDIFYDSYQIILPFQEKIISEMNRQIGFLLADALKSQLKSILADTLIQLQKEGLLYVIIETNQKCFHVTILK